MKNIRAYCLFLRKGIVSSIILFLLGTWKQVPLYYVGLYGAILIVVIFFVYHFLRSLYKKQTGLTTCFRFGFIPKRKFLDLLKKYGLFLFLVLMLGLGLLCIPWEYLWQMVFVLSLSFYLNYIGTIAYYNLFLTCKSRENKDVCK